jgi:hypothetical protein
LLFYLFYLLFLLLFPLFLSPPLPLPVIALDLPPTPCRPSPRTNSQSPPNPVSLEFPVPALGPSCSLCPSALQDSTVEPILAGNGAGSSLPLAAPAAGGGLLDPGSCPDPDLRLL